MNGTKTFAMMIAIAAVSAPAAALAQNSNHNYHRGSSQSDQGVIAVVNGTNIRLQDGRNIFLHNGTIINPRGTTLQPGQRISVTGSRGGNGTINADDVEVTGNGGRYGNRDGNDGYGNDNGQQRHHRHHDNDNDNGNGNGNGDNGH